MASKKPFVGIDLGGTNMQVGVVSPDFKLLGEAKKKTKADEGLDAVLNRIVDAVNEACVAAKIELSQLGGIGIGAPGAVDPKKGVVLEAVNLRWKNQPIAQLLTKKTKVPTYLDNDVNVAVYGENELGAGKGSKFVLGVWVGTGVGGGLILNGDLYYGHYLSAGEIGHTIILPSNQPGSRSLEHNCSRSAVVERIVRLIRSNRPSSLKAEMEESGPEKIKSRALAKAYHDGDALTIEVVDESAELLGTAIAGQVTMLSLERVILGGGLVEAVGKPYVEKVRKAMKKFAFPDACKDCDVVASQLEDKAGVFGAAMLAMEKL
jgi:glucokinase